MEPAYKHVDNHCTLGWLAVAPIAASNRWAVNQQSSSRYHREWCWKPIQRLSIHMSSIMANGPDLEPFVLGRRVSGVTMNISRGCPLPCFARRFEGNWTICYDAGLFF